MEEKQLYCTFQLGHLNLGVEVSRVQEVIRYQQMTGVPSSPDVVEGLMNLRGQIVMAIDLRRRFELPPREGDVKPMNVIIRSNDSAISLLVDEIGDVMEVDKEQFETVPDTLQGVKRELVTGAYKLDDSLLMIIDADEVVQWAA